MEIKKELITPEKAAKMLESMGKNRHLNVKRERALENVIKRGEYTLSNDLICFDEDGNLINGQHRLNAICEAGIPVEAFVWYGAPKDIVVDRGLPRATGEALWMRGLIDKELSGTACTALINAFFRVCGPRFIELTLDERAEFMNHYEDQILSALSIQRSKNGSIAARAGVGAGILAALIYGIDEERLIRFGEVVNSGYANGPSESAAVTLRNWLIDTTGFNGGSASDMQASSTEQAIRDFVKGKARYMKYSRINHVYIKQLAERWTS